MKIMVAGAGGFIGSHLTNSLVEQGHDVLAVDKKKLSKWEQINDGAESLSADLSVFHQAQEATRGMDQVYLLAADMGGMGFIETHKLDCMFSGMITMNVIKASLQNNVNRLFYSSSACIYPAHKQNQLGMVSLKESDAWPADPEAGYGLEKLYGEELCHWAREESGMQTRIARFHNVYGTHTAWIGGREKAPAAICRKVAEAKLYGTDSIEIWGDGEQERSFMFIDDCVKGSQMIMNSDFVDPLNLGSSESVTVNQLVSLAEEIAGVKLKRNYDLTAPQGVRGRNSDNTLIKSLFKWEPSITLSIGLEKTYSWVADQVKRGR